MQTRLAHHARWSVPRAACALAATGVVLVVASGCQQAPPATPAPTTESQTASISGDGAAASVLTVGTTEGPYYITNTAQLSGGDLNATGLPGEPIKITGFVYEGTDALSPIANAKVEIWHADSDGNYRPNSNGDASQYDAGELALRGYVLTDPSGRYEFTSIYPGYYPGRTRHIHVRVSADGFGGVATQIIVPPKTGDGVTPETDGIAQSLPEANFVTFADEAGVGVGSFDFHIARD